MVRQIYLKRLVVNGKRFRRVIVDSHYEERHPELNDKTVLGVVEALSGLFFLYEKMLPSGYLVFVTEPVWADAKPYRLVWTYHPENDYLGVITCFRVRKKNYGKA